MPQEPGHVGLIPDGLRRWADALPLDAVAESLAAETDPTVAGTKRRLLKHVVKAVGRDAR